MESSCCAWPDRCKHFCHNVYYNLDWKLTLALQYLEPNMKPHQVRKLTSLLLIFLCFALTPLHAQSVSPDLFSGLKWRLIGPFRGGRAAAAAGVPGDPDTFYFGAVGGGVWKTTNAGVTWTPIFDSQPVASIGAIAVAPSNPKVIYIGTGESDIRSDLASGDGVYKSTDGGESWQNIGLRDTRQISRIVIDPQNPDIVYVGALGHAYGPNDERGVFKSTDGGQHLDASPGQRSGDSASPILPSHLPIRTCSSPATWNAHRPPWSTYAPIDGPGGGLYRSQDSGATWTQLTGHGLPDGDWGRAGVAVSPDGKRVYALIDAGKKSGLYRSDDGGDNWTLANSDPRLTSRAWYFSGHHHRSQQSRRRLHPQRRALSLGRWRQDHLDRSRRARRRRLSPALGRSEKFLAHDSRRPIRERPSASIAARPGRTWYNQPTAQLYHVITDNQFPYTVYGAQQDSGSIAVPQPHRSRPDHRAGLVPVGGGESGYIVPDPSDPTFFMPAGLMAVSSRFDRRTSLSQDITPWPLPNFGAEITQRKYRDPWTPVLVFSRREEQRSTSARST